MKTLKTIFILLLILLLTGCASNKISQTSFPTVFPLSAEEECDKGIEVGKQLVVAFEQYHLDHGEYPIKIDQLVPKYIEFIPKTITGQEYSYKRNEISNQSEKELPYNLCFIVINTVNTICCNSVYYDGWECGPYKLP
jgi:hypothetical protein